MTSSGNPAAGNRIVIYVDAEISDIVPFFLEHVREDLQTIEEALDRGDYEAIRIIGHSMKGAGGGFGFDVITDLGWGLEQAAAAQNPLKVRQFRGFLAEYLERVNPVFE